MVHCPDSGRSSTAWYAPGPVAETGRVSGPTPAAGMVTDTSGSDTGDTGWPPASTTVNSSELTPAVAGVSRSRI